MVRVLGPTGEYCALVAGPGCVTQHQYNFIIDSGERLSLAAALAISASVSAAAAAYHNKLYYCVLCARRYVTRRPV